MDRASDTYARALFATAGAFNFLVGVSLLLLRPWVVPLLSLDPIEGSNAALVNVASTMVIVFGYASLRAAADPRRFRTYIELGLIGKLLVLPAAAWPWLTGAAGWQLPALASGDLVFALLFWDYLRRTRS